MPGKFQSQNPRRRQHPDRTMPMLLLGLLAFFVVMVLLGLALPLVQSLFSAQPGLESTGPVSQTTLSQPEQTTLPTTQPATTQHASQPTDPPVTETTVPPLEKVATATIGATGDLLLHDRVIASGLNASTGQYNYDNIFGLLAPYIQKVDYAVANLEVTLCGDQDGYTYSGYPCFNSPDAIVDAAATAGFDMLLTANNHSYDTRFTGFIRTQQVISDRGLQYIGTKLSADEPDYVVQNVGGIRIGMTCYTYETAKTSSGNKTLNGISLTAEASALINSFSYKDLGSFYADLAGEIAGMKEQGAEAIVVFIHWGDELELSPNKKQKDMAQAMCNLGVDVIVGGHPHVIQPVQLLTSENDSSHKTLCAYSLGNCVSNYRGGKTWSYNTEDGMFFTFTFAKYSDGTVVVEEAGALPFWVYRHVSATTSKDVYLLLPLDREVGQWKRLYGLTDAIMVSAEAACQRTEKIVGQGLEEANAFFRQRTSQLAASLGIE